MMNSKEAREILLKLIALIALALLLGALACVPPSRTDYSPDDEVDDSGGPPSGDDDDSVSGDDDDTASNSDCEADEVDDCEDGCTPASWLGDGECDDDLNCEEHLFDHGDCLPEE